MSDLASSVDRLKLDKVVLEQAMEEEEENITNRLQRQVDLLLASFRQVESKLQAKGSSLAELGVAPPCIDVPGRAVGGAGRGGAVAGIDADFAVRGAMAPTSQVRQGGAWRHVL